MVVLDDISLSTNTYMYMQYICIFIWVSFRENEKWLYI